MKDVTELRIYGLAVDIGESVWAEVCRWGSFPKWTIGKQLTEAADGIAATMMEGYYRYSPREHRKFFQYSLSSAKETQLWWWRAKVRGLIADDTFQHVQQKLDDLVPQTINYILLLNKTIANL